MIFRRASLPIVKNLIYQNFTGISHKSPAWCMVHRNCVRTLANMSSIQFLQIGNSSDRKIAYKSLNFAQSPTTIIFVNGYMSCMDGKKAEALSSFCQQKGVNYVRFDVEGIGESGGDIEKVQFGDWIEDLQNIIDKVVKGPFILVGSSMGCWLSLKCAIANASRLRSMILIAPALNFIRPYVNHYYSKLSSEDKAKMDAGEAVVFKNQYGTVYLRKDFSDNTQEHEFDLKKPIPVKVPIRILHGMTDPDVPFKNSIHLASLLESDDIDILFRKNGKHQLSEPEDIKLLERTVVELLERELSPSKL